MAKFSDKYISSTEFNDAVSKDPTFTTKKIHLSDDFYAISEAIHELIMVLKNKR